MPKHCVLFLVYVAMSSLVSNSFAGEDYHKPQTGAENALHNTLKEYQAKFDEEGNVYNNMWKLRHKEGKKMSEQDRKEVDAKTAQLKSHPINFCISDLYYTSKVMNDQYHYKKIKPNPKQLSECRKYFSEHFLKAIAKYEFENCNNSEVGYSCGIDWDPILCAQDSLWMENIKYKTLSKHNGIIKIKVQMESEYGVRDSDYYIFHEGGVWKIYDTGCRKPNFVERDLSIIAD